MLPGLRPSRRRPIAIRIVSVVAKGEAAYVSLRPIPITVRLVIVVARSRDPRYLKLRSGVIPRLARPECTHEGRQAEGSIPPVALLQRAPLACEF
jgi:hypothetical protein